MRIVFPDEMKKIVKYCEESLGLNTISLMENAASSIKDCVVNIADKSNKILAICGGGNNGADGLAALRKLGNLGYSVKAILVGYKSNENVQLHRSILEKENVEIHKAIDCDLDYVLKDCDVILDCIFGIGFRGDIDKDTGYIIDCINRSGKKVVSVDIPSGVYGESGKISNYCVKADITVVLSDLKPGNVVYPGRECCGKLYLSDIGIPSFVKRMFAGNNEYLNEGFNISNIVRKREKDTHKGDYGRVCIIAGSRGMTGAAILCAESALRSGAGYVYMISPAGLVHIFESVLKEPVKIPVGDKDDVFFKEEHVEEVLQYVLPCDSVVIGPGLGIRETTKEFVRRLISKLKNENVKVILDADSINAFEGKCGELEGDNIVITPHYGEFRRLTGTSLGDRIKDAMYFNDKGITSVLKGASTITSHKNSFTVNGTGNPGMAVCGSGDVLCGIIAAFAARMSLYDAARYGVWVHGLSGDKAKELYGEEAMISGDLINMLPKILKIDR
ncbi:MAG: NAD(P)H-hydrate dehydratase [Clostridiaceae bacterium]|nr:NAD(P)H-hydrate dehydratase [Clostridiaceae bacterium]